MKPVFREWVQKWWTTPHKAESKLRTQEWRMAAKTPSFNMFDIHGKPIEEDPVVREAREEMERARHWAALQAIVAPAAMIAPPPPITIPVPQGRQRVSNPDYPTIDKVGELARAMVAQRMAINEDLAQRLRELGDPTQEIAEQTEFDRLPIVAHLDIKEVEEQEWEVMARTTTTRRRRTATTPGRAQVSGPTTKNDPVFVWGMQSSKPRAGGQFITYEVRLNDDGSLSCNCPGWIFKKKTDDRGCKHTRHDEVVSNFKDFFERFKRGEQLPTIDPPQGQASATTSVPRTPTAKDQMQGFGRLIILDD